MLIFYGTGVILGAGIYSIIGKGAGAAGDTLWISFIIAAVSALLTSMSYAELAAMYPKAGAEYVYLNKAFEKRPWIGFSVGLAVAVSGAATAATVAIAFSGYLGQFIDSVHLMIPFTILTVFTGLAILGIQVAAWANIIFTLIEIGGLGLIIYLGVQNEKFGEALSAAPNVGTLVGSALVIFSFFGFETIANLSQEAKNPARDIPRAILISLLFTAAVYIAVSLAALALVPHEKLADSEAPLMLVAQTASKKIGFALGVVALFSTANTALISMIGASRILFGMAESKSLPQGLTKVLPAKKTPWVASLVILAVSLAFLPLGKIETVASVSSLSTLFAFAAVNLALIFLRFSDSKRERPFRVPLSIKKVPVLPALGLASSLVFMTQYSLIVYFIGAAFVALTVLLRHLASARFD